MKKKKVIIPIIIIFLIALSVFLGTGFQKRSDVFLADYTKNSDSITLNVGVSSSMGYVRDLSVQTDGSSKFITFYPCFGGLNSSLGAKNEFEIDVPSNCEEIYFYSGDDNYTLVLVKDERGIWHKADNDTSSEDVGVVLESTEDFEDLGIPVDAPENSTDTQYSMIGADIVSITFILNERAFVLNASKIYKGEDLHGLINPFVGALATGCEADGEDFSYSINATELEEGNAFATSQVNFIDNEPIYLSLTTTDKITLDEILDVITDITDDVVVGVRKLQTEND
ncbi:MAG: hypothetical protein R3Y09_00670 [Clostridia bacterium]